MIDQATIDKIFAAVDIVEVISDFVSLKKSGTNFKGISPFTNEKTPSFFVSPSKRIFKCFSSGVGGNAVSFIMEHEKLSYPEALRYLAKKYNIEIVEKEQTPEEIQEKNERESILAVTEFAARQFVEWLKHREEGKAIGLSYLKERGLREAEIDKFQLGYSLEIRDALTKLAQEKGYKKEYLVKSGLTVDKNDYVFDRFAGRVIFPIHSISGQVIGFGGRILKKDVKAAKYLNSPESEIYHKSHVLYGLYQAKNSIIQSDKCFLVEGYTDVISLHQAGIENVVASSGTALSSDQVRLIKRFTKNVTVLYDGDEAGIKASLRGIDLILEEGLNVKVLLLPEGEDPDSYSRSHSNSELLEYIRENETDFIKFKTRLLAKDAENDPVRRATLISDVVRSIAVIPDNIIRAVYIRECSKILDIDESLLYNETHKIRRDKAFEQSKKSTYIPEYQPPNQVPQKKEIKLTNDFPHERDVLQILLKFGNHELHLKDETPRMVWKYIIEEIKNDELEFMHPIYKKVFDYAVELYSENTEFDDRYFIQHEDHDICKTTVDLTTDNYELSTIWKKNEVLTQTEDMRLKEIVPEIVIAFKNKKVLDMIRHTQEDINKSQKSNDLENLGFLQQKLIVLNELKKSFSKKLGDRIII
ncbi:MAG: DNA primase [Bacteroidales bacterium]|nr:DNA primase [Bacteroidales bacterium]